MKKILTVVLVLCMTMGLMTGCNEIVRTKENLEAEKEYRLQGIAAMEEGNYILATELFQLALDQSMGVVDKLEIDICYYKALAQYKAGQVEEALSTYTALVQFDPTNADVYYLRGTIYLELGQKENAAADYEEATNHVKDIVLYNRMAEKLIGAGCTDSANEILKKTIKVSEDGTEGLYQKGRAYYLMQDYEMARTYFDKAINKGYNVAIYDLAKTLEALGEKEQANELYENYVLTYSDDTDAMNSLGCAKMEDGDYEVALNIFRAALEMDHVPNEQELRRNEIIALEYLLDFDTAKIKMKLYVQDYPDDLEAAREYEFLKSR